MPKATPASTKNKMMTMMAMTSFFFMAAVWVWRPCIGALVLSWI